MAGVENVEDQNFLSFACDHLMVETVSTAKLSLMCRLHTPVYLFENSYLESFVKWHFGVRNTSACLSLISSFNPDLMNWSEPIVSFPETRPHSQIIDHNNVYTV